MNFLEINIQNPKQGILTKSNAFLTIIHTDEIKEGLVLIHQNYSSKVDDKFKTLRISKILEDRKGKGNYPNNDAPNFAKCEYENVLVPIDEYNQYQLTKK